MSSVATFLFVGVNVFRLENAAPDVQIALRKGNFDPGFAQFSLDREIQIAPKAAGSMAHLAAPDDKLEIDRALAETFEENTWRWIL